MKTLFVCVAAFAACGLVAACANVVQESDDAGMMSPELDASKAQDSSKPKSDASSNVDATTFDAGTSDVSTTNVPDAAAPKPIVYGHSPDTLFAFDTTKNTITQIAMFSGCTQGLTTTVIDFAVDAQLDAFATTVDGLYSVDLTTAECTLVKAGSYPNSLSFVPAGTLDPTNETLVGYFGAQYVSIDTSTGAVTSIGTGLTGGYASSGDVVSVKGGGTFLTVTGNGCGDCLLQVDPVTGDLVQNYGVLPHGAVYGLGYWAGSLYGFDQGGDIFTITSGSDGGIATSDIVTDGGVAWYGAGSTTLAPVTASDGGVIATE